MRDIEESSSYNRKYIYDDINREPVSVSVILIPFFREKRKRGLVSSPCFIFELRNGNKSNNSDNDIIIQKSARANKI